MKNLLRFVLTIGFAIAAAQASAAPPPTINYQGYLTGPTGTPTNSPVVMTFKLYNTASGGAALYTEVQPSVAVNNGNFNAVIGSTAPLALPFDVPYWLTVTINADPEMSPRQPLASSAYAFRASTADSVVSVNGSQITGSITTATIPVANVVGAVAGPVGPQGPQGIQGTTGLTGTTGPAGSAGATGATGTAGNTVLSGIGVPAAALGVNGNFYINTAANTIHGPKAAGAWPAGVALVGPQGPIGTTGAAGAAGATGATGAQGVQGVAGVTGAAGAQGPIGVTGAQGPIGATGPAGPNNIIGNLTMVNSTSSTVGNILKGGVPFIHNFGTDNTFIGLNAGNFFTTGSNNIGAGAGALPNNLSGGFNIGIGRTLTNNGTGSSNVAIGDLALDSGNGSNNTAVGDLALRSNTASNNTALGSGAGSSLTTGDNNIDIGNSGVAGESSTTRIGTSGFQTKTFIAGIRGVTPLVAGVLPVVIDSAGQLGTAATLNLGQAGGSVFGSTNLIVTPTTPATPIPGLTTTITVPSGAVVLLTTDGAISTTSTVAAGFSAVQVFLTVDGVIPANGGFQQVIAANTSGVTSNMTSAWGMSLVVAVPAGSHTFAVRVSGVSTPGGVNASVSGGTGSVTQGTLTAVVLKL